MTLSFAPELSHVIELDGTTVFATLDGVVGVALSQEVLDVESMSAEPKVGALLQALQGLPEGVLLRVRSRVTAQNELPFSHARGATLLEKGFIQESVQVSFEKQDRGLAVPRLRE